MQKPIIKLGDIIEYTPWSGRPRQGKITGIERCGTDNPKYGTPVKSATIGENITVTLDTNNWCFADQITSINGQKISNNPTNMSNTKVVCPKCGAEFEIPEHEHITVGIAIGRDSNLGTIHPKVVGQDKPADTSGNAASSSAPSAGAAPAAPKTGNKSTDRLAALKAAGVDTAGIFAMRSADGNGFLARMNGDVLSIIEENDPIFNAIKEGNTIPERRLFRRWVMAQVFHMLDGKKQNFSDALHHKGYEYSWKMTEEELRVQMRLAQNDAENFAERNRWFNDYVAVNMALDYIKDLENTIKKMKEHRCKGIPYVKIDGKDIFVRDLQRKVFNPLNAQVKKIREANTPAELYYEFKQFNRMRPLHFGMNHKSFVWDNAFKGSGAYYTLKNLILFHNCTADGCSDRNSSLALLETLAGQYEKEGWRMLAYLKKFLADNNINIKAKMREWQTR